MAIFDGEAETLTPIDLSDEGLGIDPSEEGEGQAEEQPQEETMQESPAQQTSEPANEETAPQESGQAEDKETAKLRASYHALLQDYNSRNAMNNRTIADLRAEIEQLKANVPKPAAPELDPEIANIIDPFLKQAVAPFQQKLEQVQNELNARKEQENRQQKEGAFNKVMGQLPTMYPEIKGAEEQAQVLAEAVKISTMSNNPQLYLEYPEMVINMAVQNLYGESRKEKLAQAVNAAAEQARLATMQAINDKENNKSGKSAQSINNKTEIAATPSAEEQILADIMNAQGSGLFT